MKRQLNYDKVVAQYNDLISERYEFEQEWRSVSDYLIPGRGIYSHYSKPQKRQLTSKKVVNNTAEDALYVLTSSMHGALTSPSRPWYRFEWSNEMLMQNEMLVAWLQQAQNLVEKALQVSNFYSIINSFYIEYAGFGTGAIASWDNQEQSGVPVRFELLTAGEYVFSTNAKNVVDTFFRIRYYTPRMMVDAFGRRCSKDIRRMVSTNAEGIDSTYITILEAILPYPYRSMFGNFPYTRIVYAIGEASASGQHMPDANRQFEKPLLTEGFYEMPYNVARWNTIGSDVYGIGPGARALPDIKRLQEMERTFLMAAHKSVDPPLNAPHRMKGKINRLPGGMNYYSNPQEMVVPLEGVRYDFQGVMAAIERTEERIKKTFFNDIFLIPSRGDAKSPLKATEVTVREQEKMLRLGPVVERLQYELFQPMLSRVFQVLRRHEYLPPLPPEYEEILDAHGFKVVLISPMATAQRAAAIQGIYSYMSFLANAAQFKQDILDNIDSDRAAREVADVNGVEFGILRPQEEVDKIRQQRAQEMAREKAKQEEMQRLGMQSQLQSQDADTRKTGAEAAATLVEAQATAAESGQMM